MSLANELSELACRQCGTGEHWIGSSSVVKRQNSRIHQARCGSCGVRVIVKQSVRSHSVEADPMQAATEFDVLTRLHLSFPQSERFGTPVPLGHLLASSSVATQFVSGAPVSQRLPRASIADRELMVAMAAQWLRKLHDCFGEGVCEVDVARKVRTVLDRWSAGGQLGRKVSEALHCLENVGRSLEGVTFPRVWLHGDFKPENLLFDGKKIVGLDCALRHANAPIFDLAPFLVHLMFADAGFAGFRGAKAGRLGSVFLESYYSDERWSPLAVSWACLYFLLSYWCSSVERSRFLRPFYDLYYAPLVASVIRSIGPRKTSL